MQSQSLFSTHIAPLAERMRPKTLDDVIGQDHLVGPGKLFRQAIENDTFGSSIFCGPPSCGKTTIANVIAQITERPFVSFHAAFNGIKDIKETIERARKCIYNGGKSTILFVDEIHRFNKAQQDAFLQPVEKGILLLIGATTENPSFEINSALLSRCSVYTLNQLQDDHIKTIIKKALEDKEYGLGNKKIIVKPDAKDILVNYANGDARSVLNVLDIATQTTKPNESGECVITKQLVKEVMSSRRIAYDKKGEEFYNLISALHKSMRGSDPQAALYWLARMIEGGADPLYIVRRLVRFASEDIGLADPQALVQAMAAKEAVHFIGFPEGDTTLAQCVVYLATAPKSNKLYEAIVKARHDVRETRNEPVPMHIRNVPTKPTFFSEQSLLPESLGEPEYYVPGPYGFERDIKKRIAFWKHLKEEQKL